MIQNYYNSLPKWKKILIISILVVFIGNALFPGIRYDDFSDRHPILAWLGEKFNVEENITDEIFSSLAQSLEEFEAAVLENIYDLLTSPFKPQLDTFNEKVFGYQGNSVPEVLAGHTGGVVDGAGYIESIGIFFGVFVSTILFFLGLYKFFLAKVSDTRDTPIKLIFRYAIAVGICMNNRIIVNTVLEFFNDMQVGLEDYITNPDNPASFFRLASQDGSGVKIFGILIATTALPALGLICIAVEMIILFIILKRFLKLYLELISRYITSVVFLLLFSAFACTLVSEDTSQIFKSYLRVLFSSFALLIFNQVWFGLCLGISKNLGEGGNTDSITILEFLFLLEMLSFGTKFDSMLRSMGISVAANYGALGQSFGMAGNNIMRGLRNADYTRKSAGGVLKALGAATGNKAMHDMGNKMSAPVGDLVSGKVSNDLVHFGASQADLGRKFTDKELGAHGAAHLIGEAMRNPYNEDAQKSLGALTDGQFHKGVQDLMANSGYKLESAKMSKIAGADGNMRSAIEYSASRTDNKGKTQNLTGKLGANSVLANGNDLGNGLAFRNNAPIGKGDAITYGSLKQLGNTSLGNAADTYKLNSSDTSFTNRGKDKNTPGNTLYSVKKGDNIVGALSVNNDTGESRFTSVGQTNSDTLAMSPESFAKVSAEVQRLNPNTLGTEIKTVGVGKAEVICDLGDGSELVVPVENMGYFGNATPYDDPTSEIFTIEGEGMANDERYCIKSGKKRTRKQDEHDVEDVETES